MSEWNLLPEAYIVSLPTFHTVTGERGPTSRLVVATEERAKQLCESGPRGADGQPARTYVRATEANLAPGEIAGLRRAAAEKKAAEAVAKTA